MKLFKYFFYFLFILSFQFKYNAKADEIKNLELITQLKSDKTTIIKFSYDNKAIIYNESFENNSFINKFDIHEKQTKKLIEKKIFENFLTFDIDSLCNKLALIYKNKLEIYNKDFKLIKEIKTYDVPKTIKFINNSELLAIGFYNYKIKLLNLKSGYLKKIFIPEEVRLNNGITNFSFYKDFLAESGDDDRVYIHNLKKNKIIFSDKNSYEPLIFNKSSLFYNSAYGIISFDINTGIKSKITYLGADTFDYKNDYIAYDLVSNNNYDIVLKSLKTGKQIIIKSVYKNPINLIRFSNDAKFIAISSIYENNIKIYRINYN